MAIDCSESSTMLAEPSVRFPTDMLPEQDQPVSVSDPAMTAPPVGDVEDEPASAASAKDPASSQTPSLLADLIELSKPRIVVMILVTTVAAAFLAGASELSLITWAWLLIGTGLVAGSAGAANQVWERIIDSNMPRTASRPLPSGRMSFGLGLMVMTVAGLTGTALLAWQCGVMPAAVGLATWLTYVLVYTPMKTRTAWNTTVGAIAGAMPIFIGYTAAGGRFDELTGWMLFGVLAFWQFPHFMAIAWLYRRQYDEAGFKMTTTIEPSGRHAAWQSIAGSLALATCGVVACLAPAGQWRVDSVWSWLASALVVWASWPLLRASLNFQASADDTTARKMLRWSLVVLPAVLFVMTLRAGLAN